MHGKMKIYFIDELINYFFKPCHFDFVCFEGQWVAVGGYGYYEGLGRCDLRRR